jgi:trans-aconitate 2-methyltransferase
MARATTSDWNPTLYDRFADERERPSRELLARVPLSEPAEVVDLGCGSGLSTAPLVERFPAARVLGIDTSPAMLEKARKAVPQATFEIGDIANLRPDTAVDLLFANAALQWLPDHQHLIPRLVSLLAPGGVIAVQMPDNLEEPSHRGMRQAAVMGPWEAKLAAAEAARQPLLSVDTTYDLLADCRLVDLWTTTYEHVMDDHDAIIAWFKSTALRPYLDPLDEGEREEFLAAYRERLVATYPPQRNGKVLLHFPRRFFVAVK